MEEVVKQLTPLVSTGPNWPYALVQLAVPPVAGSAN